MPQNEKNGKKFSERVLRQDLKTRGQPCKDPVTCPGCMNECVNNSSMALFTPENNECYQCISVENPDGNT